MNFEDRKKRPLLKPGVAAAGNDENLARRSTDISPDLFKIFFDGHQSGPMEKVTPDHLKLRKSKSMSSHSPSKRLLDKILDAHNFRPQMVVASTSAAAVVEGKSSAPILTMDISGVEVANDNDIELLSADDDLISVDWDDFCDEGKNTAEVASTAAISLTNNQAIEPMVCDVDENLEELIGDDFFDDFEEDVGSRDMSSKSRESFRRFSICKIKMTQYEDNQGRGRNQKARRLR